ncbi:hypothetical protein O9K51_01850 [Purpureocillium lavendulum]|uniref:Uncharacterized protein n=1 Tax=Purpureocillium lavendulum TaxID=1247861 RepID=A0AB34GA98_9HYPO|nr:hypothetical protein O9K51_01850 [Purpureocillium lavendulum]
MKVTHLSIAAAAAALLSRVASASPTAAGNGVSARAPSGPTLNSLDARMTLWQVTCPKRPDLLDDCLVPRASCDNQGNYDAGKSTDECKKTWDCKCVSKRQYPM